MNMDRFDYAIIVGLVLVLGGVSAWSYGAAAIVAGVLVIGGAIVGAKPWESSRRS